MLSVPGGQYREGQSGDVQRWRVGKTPPRAPSADYGIGYGRTPEHSRFKHGQSGDPNGRRAGAPDLSSHIEAALYPRVGFIVTNMTRPAEWGVAFYNQRGAAEQHIKEGKNAVTWTRLSCTRVSEAIAPEVLGRLAAALEG